MSLEVFILNQSLWGFDLCKAAVPFSSPADSPVVQAPQALLPVILLISKKILLKLIFIGV